jgi:hypothetical protein
MKQKVRLPERSTPAAVLFLKNPDSIKNFWYFSFLCIVKRISTEKGPVLEKVLADPLDSIGYFIIDKDTCNTEKRQERC